MSRLTRKKKNRKLLKDAFVVELVGKLGIAKVEANKLEDANFYIIRSILGLNKWNTYKKVLQLVKMQTLQHRRYSQSLTLVFKCSKENGPSYVHNFFKMQSFKWDRWINE